MPQELNWIEGDYVYCEAVTAGGGSYWHIRVLTQKGIYPGGGADTDSLCGRKMAWDIASVRPSAHKAISICSKCRAEMLKTWRG